MRRLPIFLFQLGLACISVAALTLVQPLAVAGLTTPGRAGALAAAGVLVALIGLFLPAPDRRAPQRETKLDEIVPLWQFDERHETRIHASPAAVERAVRAVSAREIHLFRLLTWIRNPRLPSSREPESILAPPPDEPILAVALRSGFRALGEESGREVVIGMPVVVPESVRSLSREERARWLAALDGARFATLREPGFALAAMNFRWTDEGGGWTRLVTETRIAATDPSARRRFGAYWRLIYPGSSAIRFTWLAAIRARAERDAE